MTYDTMSVEDLLWQYSKWERDKEYWGEELKEEGQEIIAALRRAVIREASVVVKIDHDWAGEDDSGGWVPSITTESGDLVSFGTYYLIPKEEP
jgi:hypothetical protein